ncbi:MAG: hypothetical protein ACAF41_13165 [Leptolyngbya sp. BL-A-14]
MNVSTSAHALDWAPILSQIQRLDDRSLPAYPGDLKTALLRHAGLSDHPQAETVYQLASDIARLTTHCDPEIVYWFSRLLALIESK